LNPSEFYFGGFLFVHHPDQLRMLFGKDWNSTRDCQDPVINCLASLVKFSLIGAALVDFVWQELVKFTLIGTVRWWISFGNCHIKYYDAAVITGRSCHSIVRMGLQVKLPLKVRASHCAEFVWITCEKKIKKKIK